MMNKSDRKIYIAGKVTGEDRLECVAKFERAKQFIEALGLQAVNPLEVVGTWEITWENAMKKCITALMECDAVYLLPDSLNSTGAKLEIGLCAQLGIPMISDLQTLITYSNKN